MIFIMMMEMEEQAREREMDHQQLDDNPKKQLENPKVDGNEEEKGIF